MLNRSEIPQEKEELQKFSKLRQAIAEKLAQHGVWDTKDLDAIAALTTGRTRRVLRSSRLRERCHESVWELLQTIALDEEEAKSIVGNIFANGFV